MTIRRRRLLRILILILLAGAAWSFTLFWRAASAPDEATFDGRTVDAIVVLTGGGDRVAAGLDLLRLGVADRLFISGVGEKVEVADILATQPGAPTHLMDRIQIGHARNTVANASETAAWASENGVKRIVLVTAYYHMPRSLILFGKAAPALEVLPAPVEPAAASRAGWWRSPRGISVIAVEWLKFVATRLGLGP